MKATPKLSIVRGGRILSDIGTFHLPILIYNDQPSSRPSPICDFWQRTIHTSVSKKKCFDVTETHCSKASKQFFFQPFLKLEAPNYSNHKRAKVIAYLAISSIYTFFMRPSKVLMRLSALIF